MMTAVRVSGALFLLAFGLAPLSLGGCGSSGGSDKSTDGTGGTKSTAMEDAGSPVQIPEGSVGCGQAVCSVPDGVTGTACCRDAFSSLCGVNAGMGCAKPPPAPPKGCPTLPSVMGIMTAACCTSMGQCGVDLTFVGQGCIDIATAAAQAMAMGVMVGTVPAAATCTPSDGGI
ncbi:MAG TPA: hypothetical protein VH062_07930 [Polyangiaceae bacterium]|jgi:hypothetical protein|nr:hypothetical protein [Polyangiaceae bacterium]